MCAHGLRGVTKVREKGRMKRDEVRKRGREIGREGGGVCIRKGLL